MAARSLKFGFLAGIVAGAIVALAMTLLDWWRNPAGLFHDEHGTRWDIAAETAISWFWPVALIFLVSGSVFHYFLTRSGSKAGMPDK